MKKLNHKMTGRRWEMYRLVQLVVELKLLYIQPQEIKARSPFNIVYKVLLQ